MPDLKDWKEAFLKELALSPNVSRAARAAGIKRRTAYNARESDPGFAEAWDDAMAGSVDELEENAFTRAQLESDVLTIFLLKSHRPAVYAKPVEQKHTIAALNVNITPPGAADAEPEPDDLDQSPVEVLG